MTVCGRQNDHIFLLGAVDRQNWEGFSTACRGQITSKSLPSPICIRRYFSGLLIGREAVLETARTLPKHGAGVVSRTASSRRARPQHHCLSRRRSTAWASPGASRCARREPLGLPISPVWIPPSGMGVNGLRRHPGRGASPVGSSRRRVFRARASPPPAPLCRLVRASAARLDTSSVFAD